LLRIFLNLKREKKNTKLLYRTLNIWFAFIALVSFSINLPHWSIITYHMLINVVIYFLLFIVSFSIFHKEKNNRDVYFNFSILFLLHSLSFLNIFLGDDCFLGNNLISWYIYAYKTIALNFCFNFVIVFIVLKYLFSDLKSWMIYLLTFMLLALVFTGRFFPYIQNPIIIFDPENATEIDLAKRMFLANIISFLFVMLYSYNLYKSDKILGTYINLYIAAFFVWLVTQFITLSSHVYGFQTYETSSYILTFNLLFMGMISFKILFFLCSDYGEFYESLINKKISTGKVKIKRYRIDMNVQILRFLKFYFYHRRNYLLLLFFLFTIMLAYYRFPKFFTMSIIALLLSSFTLFGFVNILYKRRAKQKYTLP